jgi:predicted phage terminase large subunit-like protein
VTAAPILDLSVLSAVRARRNWLSVARARGGKQLPPTDSDWQILLARAGRGWGKTEAENQWLWWECWRIPGLIGHVIAPTQSDVRGTSFEGRTGLNSLVPAECLYRGTLEKAYNKTHHELRLANGSLIRGFSATENGQRLRGPQCHALACDEIAWWDVPAGNLEWAMNNALLGLRLPYADGTPARAVMGTTPRPIPFLRRFEKRAGVRVVTGTTYENLANLSPSLRNQLLALADTQAGRQEIDAEYIDKEGAATILRRSWIKLWPREKKLPEFSFLIESYDTATSEHNYDRKKQTTDPTACGVFGVFNVAQVFDEAERKRLGIRSRYAVLLCEAWDERIGFPELLDRARMQHKVKWGSPGRKADIVLIEEKSSGTPMRQTLASYGVPAWPYNPGRQSKTQRAHAVAPLVKQGMLWVPESMRDDRRGQPRDWCEPFLEQVTAFAGPGSTEHDDYVDVTTAALIYLHDRGMLEATPDERTIDYEERRARDQDEAVRVRDQERLRVRENPYAA